MRLMIASQLARLLRRRHAHYVINRAATRDLTLAVRNTAATRHVLASTFRTSSSDEVAPPDQQQYLRVYRQYDPLWRALTPEAQAR
jgi:hypothetical protein